MNNNYTLKICINNIPQNIKDLYMEQLTKYEKLQSEGYQYLDSGFDLFIPNSIERECCDFGDIPVIKIDHNIQCAVYKNEKPSAYYLYPRSSISNSPYMMANSVGIIDSGYRGNIMAKLTQREGAKNDAASYKITQGIKLFQLCTPTLEPWSSIEIVSQLDNTKRGAGGFGSTG